MESTLDLLTEERRKLLDDFSHCQNWADVEALFKKVEKLNESRENNEIPHLDMTYEDFLSKYHCVDADEMRKKYGI